LHSQSSFVLASPPEGINLAKYCKYFFDYENTLKISDIRSSILDPFFDSFETFRYSFPYRTSPVWIRCSIHNSSSEFLNFYLEIPYPLLDEIHYYEFSDERFISEIKTGDRYPFLQRPFEYRNFLFPIRIPSAATHDLFLRVSSKGAIIIPIRLCSEKYLISKISLENILLGLYLGISVGLLIYNIFLFKHFRELYYLYYVLFLSGLSLLMITLTGISYQYLWQNAIWWSNYSYPILIYFTATFSILFTRSVLNLEEKFLIVGKALYFLSLLNGICIAIPFLVDYSIAIRTAFFLVSLDLIVLIVASLIVFRKRERVGGYILAGWIIFGLSFLVYGLYLFNFPEESDVLQWSLYVGIIFLILIFSLPLPIRFMLSVRKRRGQRKKLY